MTAAREAIALPMLFLTVVLLAGLRFAGTISITLPTPYFLVLGVLLIRVAVQSGALAPGQLLSASRSWLANVNGVVVFATAWLAGSQTLAMLTPESGVPRLAFSVFFLIVLLNTAAASPDRRRLLRSLAVTLGSAYVLKFVVLQSLSPSGQGALTRALQALFDSVTMGALIQQATDPITAYVAFVTLALFLIGVFLLPAGAVSRDALLVRAARVVDSRRSNRQML
jgi:hypothetical protein